MSDKLQELTERLYREGLSKGKEEGEQILAKAKADAEEIIAKAEKQAAQTIADAEKKAADLQSKVESDLKMASTQCLQATKKDIENLLVGKLADVKATSDPDFLKTLIKEVAAKFSAQESTDIALVLPASLQDKLEPWVSSELASELGKSVTASFSKKISGGFNIGPKDGSWFVSLTDETFRELIAEYLRPVTRKVLFGE